MVIRLRKILVRFRDRSREIRSTYELQGKTSCISSIGVAILCLLVVVGAMLYPVGLQAKGSSDQSISVDDFMSKMKERLHLTEEQATKVQSILEESFKKCRYILNNSEQDKKTIRSEMQQIQWATDIQIGKILTEEQMKEYQKIREEQSDKTSDGAQHGAGSHRGGLRGF